MKSSYSLRKNKRGVFGLISVQQFFAIILGIALLAYVIVVIAGTLQSATILADTRTTFTSEKLTAVSSNTSRDFVCISYPGNPVCTIAYVVNNSDNVTVPALNYTQTNCAIKYSGLTMTGGLNNTNWNVTYSCAYAGLSKSQTNDILQNTSNGITGFFSSINPVYAILAILVIILVLVVLVRVVTGGSGEGGMNIRREPSL